MSAYRIIQEALTNVVRHAGGGARSTVTVAYGGDVLMVEVTDDGGLGGGQRHSAGSGHGIIGMRERVHLCRGEFSAGPLPGTGASACTRGCRFPLPQPGRTLATAAPS